MKKTVKVVLRAFFALALISSVGFLSWRATAAGSPLTVTAASIAAKSDGVMADISGFQDNEITNDVTFNKIGDSVTYSLEIKNTSDDKLTIKTITDDNSSRLVEYSYDTVGFELAAGESFKFTPKVTYKKAVTDTSKRNQAFTATFSFAYQTESGEEGVAPIEVKPETPKTFDNILSFVIIFAASIAGLALSIFFIRSANKKIKTTGIIAAIVVAAALAVPAAVKADDDLSPIIFKNNYSLMDRIVVTLTDGLESMTVELKNGDKLVFDRDPEYPGHNLEGWEDENGDEFDFDQPITGDITIHPVWSPIHYTIAFDGNGADGGEAMTNIDTDFDEEIDLPANTYTRTGHNFQGWNLGQRHFGDGDKASGLTETAGETVTLVAEWEPIHYTVAIDTDGDGTPNATYDIAYGDDVQLPDNETTGETGYLPDGWVDENGDHYDDGEGVGSLLVNDNDTVTLQPDYKPISYTVTLDTDNDGTPDTTINATYDVPVTLPANNNSQTGYNPNGWKDGNGNHYNSGAKVENLTATDGDVINLVPDFSPIAYVIEIDTDGNGDADVAMDAFYDKTVQLPTNEATQTGYNPNGWKDGSGNHYDSGAEVKNLTTVENDTVSLEPDFNPINYTISIDTNDDGTADMTIAATYDQPATLPTNNATKPGNQPNGWKDGDGNHYNNDAQVQNLTTTNGATVNLVPDWTPNHYTIWIDEDGDWTKDAGEEHELNYGDTLNLGTNNIPKAGGTPNGWKDSMGNHYDDGANIGNIIANNNQFIMISPDYIANEYDVAVDLDGNGSIEDSERFHVVYGKTSLVLPANTFTKTGHNPVGWVDNRNVHYNDGTDFILIDIPDGSSITIVPNFVPISYDVLLDSDGDGTVNQTYHISYGAQVINLPDCDATKDGYRCVGWTDGTYDIANGTNIGSYDSAKNGDSLTISPKWVEIVYQIEFVKNNDGFSSGSMLPQQVTYAQEFTIPESGFNVARYDFIGWATSADGDVVYTPGQTASKLTTEEGAIVKLYAKWTPRVYTIRYENVDDDEFMAQALTTVSLSDFDPGSSTIEIPGKPKMVGHAHSGWKHNNNDSCSYIPTIDKSDLPASGSEYILTACYNTTMINFLFSSGATGDSSVQGSVNGMTVKYGEPKELPLPPYTRTGYTVSTWWYKDGQPFTEGGKAYDADEYIEQNCVDKSVCYVSLSAGWTPHVITLHISPGEGVTDAINTIDDQQVTFGAPVRFADFGTFSRPGYIQNGWKLGDTSFGNSFSTNSWAIDGEELTLEAMWRAVRYDIDFNANADDAINEMPDMTNIEYGSGATLTLNNFSRSGYDFVGWKVDNAGELIADGASADFPVSANGQTVHLYAQWEKQKPLLTQIIQEQANDPSTVVDFTKRSIKSDDPETANGNGVNTATENGETIYYYRGQIDDNYVVWAGKCWRMLRTTFTGGVKVIYTGAATTTQVDGNTVTQCNASGSRLQADYTAFNAESTSLADVGYMYGEHINTVRGYTVDSNEKVFSSDVTKNGDTYYLDMSEGKYVRGVFNNVKDTVMTGYQYFCLDGAESCSGDNIVYIVTLDSSGRIYYINIAGYDNIEQVTEAMFENTHDSIAKQKTEAWFENNFTQAQEDQLEDAIFCNDREFDEGSFVYFASYSRFNMNNGSYAPTLDCLNKRDAFTKENTQYGNAKLNHKVGLLTGDEIFFAGYNGTGAGSNKSFLDSDDLCYWTLTPRSSFSYTEVNIFNGGYNVFGVDTSSRYAFGSVGSIGIRPIVSLKSDMRAASGDGTKTNPYIVE